MKKILFVALMALVFVGCQNNGANLSKADQKALNAATVDAVALVRASQAKVESSLKAAGFIQVEDTDQAKILKKVKAPKIKKDSEGDAFYFLYGIASYADMSESEWNDLFNETINAGKTVITVEVLIKNDQVQAIYTSAYAGWTETANYTYTRISDGLFGQLPKNEEMRQWGGYIDTFEEEADTYEDHAQFISKIAKAQEVEVQEDGYGFTSVSEKIEEGWRYMGVWLNPDENMREDMREDGITARIVYASFMISDLF